MAFNFDFRMNLDPSNFTSGLRNAAKSMQDFGSKLKESAVDASMPKTSAWQEVVNAAGIRNPEGNLTGEAIRAQKTIQGMRKTIENNLINPTKKAGIEFKDVARIVQGIIISKIFYGALNAIRNATRAVMDFTIELENAFVAYTQLLGSPEIAEDFLTVLKQFAANTPFTFQETNAAARQLLAYGIELKNVMFVMEGVMAAASLTGDSNAVDRVARALGQIQTKGRLAAEEVRQLAEAGIPVYQILREELNLTAEEMQNIGKAGIGASTAINAIVEGMTKRFGPGVDALSKTLSGTFNKLQDEALMLGHTIAGPLTDSYKALLVNITGFVQNLRNAGESGGIGGIFEALIPPRLQADVRTLVANIQLLWMALKELAQGFGPILTQAIAMALRAFNAILPVISGFLAVVGKLLQAIGKNEVVLRVLAGVLVAAATAWGIFKAQALGAMILAKVGTLITGIAGALQALATVLIAHPVGLVVTLIAASLIGAAMASDRFNAALTSLFQTVLNFLGIDKNISEIFKPIDMEDYMPNMDDYNNKLDAMNDSISDLGDSAKKAGAQLLSFDEVFRLNQDNEAIIPEIPIPELPKIPEYGFGTSGSWERGPNGTSGTWWEMPEKPPWIFKDGPWDTINDKAEEAQKQLEGVKDEVAELSEAAAEAWEPLTKFSEEAAYAGDAVRDWAKSTADAFARGKNEVSSGAADMIRDMQDAFTKAKESMDATDLVNKFKDAFNKAKESMDATGLINKIKDAFDKAKESMDATGLINKVKDAYDAAKESANAGAENLVGKAKETFDRSHESVSAFVGAASSQYRDMWANALASFAVWADASVNKIKQWATDASTAFDEFNVKTYTVIKGWAQNTLNEISSWAESALNALRLWPAEAALGFEDFSTRVTTVISTWASVNLQSIKSWVVDTGNALKEWALGLPNAISTTFASAKDGVGNWLSTIGDSLITFEKESTRGMEGWSDTATEALTGWTIPTFSELQTWYRSNEREIASSFTGALASLFTFGLAGSSSLAGFGASAGTSMAGVTTDADAMSSSVTGVFDDIKGSFDSSKTAVQDWSKSTKESFNSSKTEASSWSESIKGSFDSAKTSLTSWTTDVMSKIQEFITNSSTAISTWATNVVTSIMTFGVNVVSSISTAFSSAKTAITEWVTNTLSAVRTWAENALTAIKTFGTSLTTNISTAFNNAKTTIQTWATNALAAIKTAFNNMINAVKSFSNNLRSSISTGFSNALSSIRTFASNASSSIKSFANNTLSSLKTWATKISTAISNAMDKAKDAIKDMLNMQDEAEDKVGKGSSSSSRNSNSSRSYYSSSTDMAGHAKGGIFDKEHIAKFNEENKAEAIIPLEIPDAMQPFVDAVAQGLSSSMGDSIAQVLLPMMANSSSSSQLPPMYVGTLVADERGLRELERKMRIIGAQEDARRGFTDGNRLIQD